MFGQIYTKRNTIKGLEEVDKKLVSARKFFLAYTLCGEHVFNEGNRIIPGFSPLKDELHLLESEKRLLTNSFIANFNNSCRYTIGQSYLTILFNRKTMWL